MLTRIAQALGLAPTTKKHPLSQPTPSSQTQHDRYRAALEHERAQKDHFFRAHPYSPLAPSQQATFSGLTYFDPNPDLRLELPLTRPAQPATFLMQTSTGEERSFTDIGTITFEVDGQPATLHIYAADEGEELFLPFRDATSGKESYAAGRYLEPTLIDADTLLVDFNLAYNPYCAYNESYSCPLPPLENWLKVPIRAGEQVPNDHP